MALTCFLDVVTEGEASVETGGVGATSELVEREEFVASELVRDPSRSDLLD